MGLHLLKGILVLVIDKLPTVQMRVNAETTKHLRDVFGVLFVSAEYLGKLLGHLHMYGRSNLRVGNGRTDAGIR